MGGKKKKYTSGHKYYMGEHFIPCMGPVDSLNRIFVDDKIAWQGKCTGGTIDVSAEKLFGGAEGTEGGPNSDADGVSGSIDVLMGHKTQTKNSYLQKVLGALIPAFRGVVSIVLNQCYIGNSQYPKPWAFEMSRVHVKGWGEEQWYDEKSAIFVSGAGTIVEYLDFNAVADGVNGFHRYQGVSISAFPNEVITVSKHKASEGGQYQAWRVGGAFPWQSTVHVIKGGSGGPIETFWEFGSPSASEVELAAVTAGPFTLTGYSEYSFNVWDDLYIDNQGGLSLKIERPWQHYDMNAAHAIRECYEIKRFGLGHPEYDINDVALTAMADHLFDENMGVSFLWDRQKPVEDLIDDFLRHIDAVHYVNDEGLLTPKLIRADYDIDDLLVLNTSHIIRVERFASTPQDELVNAVTVIYDDIITGKDASVQVADSALVHRLGRINPATVQYPFFSNASIATRAAERDLRAKSNSLFTGEIIFQRIAETLNIGDVFILDLPERNAYNVVMRVFDKKKGDGKNNEIRLVFTQDIYALPEQPIMVVTPDGWVNPQAPAEPIFAQLTFELPYYELVQEMGQTEVDTELEDPTLGALGVAAVRSLGVSRNAQIMVDSGAGYRNGDELDYCPTALLATAMDYKTTSITFSDEIDIDIVSNGSHAQIDNELVVITDLNLTARTATIGRGVLDTVPEKHLVGARIWFWDFYSASDSELYVDGQTISVKVLPNSSSGRLSISEATAQTVEFSGRAARPYPPGNLKVNGQAYPDSIGSTDGLSLTWAHRDRVQQTAGTLQDTTVGDIGPEPGTTYTLKIYDRFDLLIRTASAITNSFYNYSTSQEASDSGFIGGSYIQEAYWDKTTLLLNFNGANNSPTFTDSSGNFLLPNGDVKLSTAEYKYGSSSAYFDGAADYLKSKGVVLTGDFTIEMWVFPTSTPTNANLVCVGEEFSGRIGFYLNSGVLKYNIYGIGGSAALSTTTVGTSSWTHIAISRSGSSLKSFINGILESTITLSGSLGNSAALIIGSDANGASSFNGYIDDARITLASRYSSTFTPPDELGKYVKGSGFSDNLIVLNFDGINGQNNFADASDLGLPVTFYGTAALTTSISKFGDSCLDLDGASTSYIAVEFDLSYSGSGTDLTIQCFARTSNVARAGVIAANGTTSSGTKSGWLIGMDATGRPYATGFTNTGATAFTIFPAGSLSANTWYHVALVRSGTTWRFFIDGVSQGTATETAVLGVSGSPLSIGRDQFTLVTWLGQIDDFSIQDNAVWTVGFTPPSQSILPVDANWSDVILLSNFKGADGSTVFYDTAPIQKIGTTVGNAKISTAQFKYGTAAGNFDGTNSRVTFPASSKYLFTGNFTIEAWIYISANSATADDGRKSANIFSLDDGSATTAFQFYIWGDSTATGTGLAVWDGSSVRSVTYAITQNAWHHVAISRDSTTINYFVDGVKIGTATKSGNMGTASYEASVGGRKLSINYYNYFNGYLDDLRVTNGVARYTDTFDPPTEELGTPISTTLNPRLRFELQSVRDGIESYQKHDIEVIRE